MKRVGIIVFPGSNCDHDAYHACKKLIGADTRFIWHQSTDLEGCDVIILPGGFSYGDYLRAGAIAKLSPVMKTVVKHANSGGYVVGICNGFQILCETKLLPGSLSRNHIGEFRCKRVLLRVDCNTIAPTLGYTHHEVVSFPIAHGEGRFVAPDKVIDQLEGNNQIVFRYCNANGQSQWGENQVPDYNPNGSSHNIAGITNESGNVIGLMPHPERAAELELGCEDGYRFFKSLLA